MEPTEPKIENKEEILKRCMLLVDKLEMLEIDDQDIMDRREREANELKEAIEKLADEKLAEK